MKLCGSLAYIGTRLIQTLHSVAAAVAQPKGIDKALSFDNFFLGKGSKEHHHAHYKTSFAIRMSLILLLTFWERKRRCALLEESSLTFSSGTGVPVGVDIS